jgi:hypothetical protein
MRQFPNTYDSTQHIYYCIYELHFYKDYIRRYERLIKEENAEYEKFLNDPDSYFELGPKFNFQHNHSASLSNEFPNTLRRSTFISLWSYFENSLNVLCEVYEFHLSLNVNYNEMRGKGIDRSKLYLRKIIGLEFPASSNWDKIRKLQRIRNNIVHSYSELRNDDAQLLSDLATFSYIKLYPLTLKSIIEIEELFLESIIDVFESFYVELLESIKKKV